jgi:autophagy-related protein 13
MHQHPRPSPRTASAANNLQTNPTRTNNQRNRTPYSDTNPYGDRGADEEGEMVDRLDQMSEVEQRNYQKINQIIQVRLLLALVSPLQVANHMLQQFFIKATLTIVSARTTLPHSFNKSGELKQNKWVWIS